MEYNIYNIKYSRLNTQYFLNTDVNINIGINVSMVVSRDVQRVTGSFSRYCS